MKKYISEFVGTCLLTLIACGVAVIVGCDTAAGIVATSLAFGLVVVAMAYSIGNVSGCHINPAVSLGMYVSGKMELKECIKYMISQILGAFLGSVLLGVCLGSFELLGANGYGGILPNGMEVTLITALLVEVILTFVFVTTILGVTDKKENGHITGLIIGLTLVLVHLFGISITGTSVNPARSLAPAILQGGEALRQVWVFIVAPLVGSVLAGGFYKFVLKTSK
ncbi:MAG: MIP family channel protein [Bacilli bacterium]|nr:MIP family channel protein [Bacilli bacterium]